MRRRRRRVGRNGQILRDREKERQVDKEENTIKNKIRCYQIIQSLKTCFVGYKPKPRYEKVERKAIT